MVIAADEPAKERQLLISRLPITSRALHSEDLNSSGKVEVRATLVSLERQNAMLEDIVQRLGLEPGVSVVSWELATQDLE